MSENSEDFKISSELQSTENVETSANHVEGNKVIDEANYNIRGPKEARPTAIGRGGDPLFRKINASREKLIEIIEETGTIQDFTQREISNNVALTCLENEDLKEVYFAIKDGFGEYGKITLMGYKTPMGVEIPRLKIYDTNGDVLEVLTGPLAIDELNKRALAYRNASSAYEELPLEGNAPMEIVEIKDYNGNLG